MTRPSATSIWFDRPGATWFDGLPIGNGRMGGMIYGDAGRQILDLNDETFWSPGTAERDLTGAFESLTAVRERLAHGDVLGAQAIAEPMLGTPHRGAALQPVGALDLSVPGSDDDSHTHRDGSFRRSLDLSTGVASFEWELAGGQSMTREAAASRAPSVLLLRQRASRPNQETLASLRSPFPATRAGGTRVGAVDGGQLVLHGTWAEVSSNRRLVAESYRLRDFEGGRALRFALGVRVLEGPARFQQDALLLPSAGWVLAVATATDLHGDDPVEAVNDALRIAADTDPAELFTTAIETHREAFERASIRLSADPESDIAARLAELSTDRRVHAVRAGGIDDDLTILLADYGRYLLIASTLGGTTPPTLQGIWNPDTEPAWCSNWTMNINLQMNCWSSDAFGLVEVADVLDAFVVERAELGSRTARELYGSSGWVIHHNSDIWGNTAPTTMIEVGLFAGAGLWLVQQLLDHALHYPERATDSRLLTLLEGAIEFISSWLVESHDGLLVVSPSSSPENAYLVGETERPRSRAVDPEYWRHGWLGEGPSLDQWLVRDTLIGAIEIADRLGLAAHRSEEWKALLNRLRPVPLEEGIVPEWTWSNRPLELGHRHLSPLYPIYPGRDDATANPLLASAARRTLLEHQANVTSSSNGWGGWSRVWAAAIWARLGDGDRALASLNSLVTTGIAPDSLLHAFPEFDGSPAADAVHQSDANLGFPAVVAELVMQSQPGRIRLLPALPSQWHAGRVDHLRATGGVDVSFGWSDSAVTEARLVATVDQHLVVTATAPAWAPAAGQTCEIDLKAGVERVLHFARPSARSEEGLSL